MRSESECSAGGTIVPSWRKSCDFLSGGTEATTYRNSRAGRTVVSRKAYPRFDAEAFEPFAGRYEE